MLLVLALGLVLGLLLGALGGGGSVLTVPALTFLVGLSAQEAVSASLVVVGVTAAVAAVGHARSGGTRWRVGLVLAAASAPASWAGTRLGQHVSERTLLLSFAVLTLVAAAGMLVRARAGTEAASGEPAGPVRSGLVRLLPVGLVVGVLTGFLGVGGGFLLVPALVVVVGLPMGEAVGTSLVVVALGSAAALAARAGGESIDLGVVLPFAGAAVLASWAGAAVAARTGAARLTTAFALLLVGVGAWTAVRAW